MPQKRHRERLTFKPKWEGPVRGWTKKFIARNMWRCDAIYDFNDHLNDCYLIFMKIAEYYPRVVEERHFMALYKTSVINAMHDKSRYRRIQKEVIQETSLDVSELYTGRIGELSNSGYLLALLAEAPEELRQAIHLLATDPGALLTEEPDGKHENLNMKLRRLLGFDKMIQEVKYDFVTALKELLT